MLAYRSCQAAGLVPSIWMMRNPFKIYEFDRVMERAGLQPGHVALDLGCGKGFQTQVIARRCGRALGFDVSETQIAAARQFLVNSLVEKKTEFFCAKVEEAKLPAASLDRVFSFCVLEHIPNLADVLAELRRLLKPGGELHASVDALASIKDPALIARHKQDHHVVQYFTPATLRAQMEAAGFEVMEIFPIMKSDFARDEFVTRIQSPDFSRSLWGRYRFSSRLRGEDRRVNGQDGIMLVVRARRA